MNTFFLLSPMARDVAEAALHRLSRGGTDEKPLPAGDVELPLAVDASAAPIKNEVSSPRSTGSKCSPLTGRGQRSSPPRGRHQQSDG